MTRLDANTRSLQKGKAKVASAPKKAAAPKAPKTSKAAPKKMVQTTLKTTKAASKKRPKPDSDDEEEEDSPSAADPFDEEPMLSNTPPSAKKQKKAPAAKKQGGKPLQDIANESMNLDGPADPKRSFKDKSATDRYQKLTQLEHIIKRPDTYIGSVERTEQQMWVFNSEISQMEFRKVHFVPGLYKIFDEILVNAADNKQNDKNMKSIKVVVDREKGEISVENDGAGIPIEIHQVRHFMNL
jgi:DNA topoisomerase II